jgi:hypothetical protein
MIENRCFGVLATVGYAIVGVLLGASAAMGCAAEEDPDRSESHQRADLKTTGETLQRDGVHFISASGQNEEGTFTLYDREQVAIGGVRTTNQGKSAEVDWKRAHWLIDYAADDEAPPTVHRDGVLLAAASADETSARPYTEAERILFESLADAKLPSQVANAQ